MPVPMAWAPVEQAEEMPKEAPCSLNCVESTAETLEPIVRVTR